MSGIEIGSVVRVTQLQEGDGPRLAYARIWEGEVVTQFGQYATLRKDGVEINVRTVPFADGQPVITVEVLKPPPPVPGYYLVRASGNSAAVVRYWDGDVWLYTPPSLNQAVAAHQLRHYIIVERIEQS